MKLEPRRETIEEERFGTTYFLGWGYEVRAKKRDHRTRLVWYNLFSRMGL